jgi:2-polyprenyl-6-methoxyphenol hydroxylase-like FAD-dependent oxidoreductase
VNHQKHAIVMGASMAGLLAARALSDHFQHVTILERDLLPTTPDHRRGVPQARHTHGLLAGGREQLERMFPGLTQQAIDGGAVPSDIVESCHWFISGGRMAQVHSGLEALGLSRPFLESIVRQRTLAIPNIATRQGVTVEGLVTSADQSRVTGIVLNGEPLAADLVIDATGRASKTPLWLKDLGYPAPPEEKIEIGVRYTTRHFLRRPTDLDGKMAAIIPPTPGPKRGGVMIAQEGHRWTVTLISHFGEPAPEDLAGFIAWSGTLPAAYIYNVIRHAEPIGEAAQAGMPASLRRRYEALDRFPQGFLVIGDALCSFNPIYGQGMTVAAMEARALSETLAEPGPALARRFFTRAARAVDAPWTMAVGNDLRMPETIGPRTLPVRLINWYVTKLQRAAHTDGVLACAFHRVGNLLDPPASLLRPHLAWRVFTR